MLPERQYHFSIETSSGIRQVYFKVHIIINLAPKAQKYHTNILIKLFKTDESTQTEGMMLTERQYYFSIETFNGIRQEYFKVHIITINLAAKDPKNHTIIFIKLLKTDKFTQTLINCHLYYFKLITQKIIFKARNSTILH